jgi:hypothetical protein
MPLSAGLALTLWDRGGKMAPAPEPLVRAGVAGALEGTAMPKRKKPPVVPAAPAAETSEEGPHRTNEYLKAIRVRVAGSRGMKRFATLCGLPYTTYRNYEMGRNRVPFEAARIIASATGDSPFALVAGGEEPPEAPKAPRAEPRPRARVLHARGRVELEGFPARGLSRERRPLGVSEEEFGKGDDFLKGGDRFVLVARGASMRPAILEGDFLVFARGAKPASGDVVCASVGNEMTVRRYFPDGARKIVCLQSDNGSVPPRILCEGKPEMKKFRIEGVLVSLRRAFGKGK